jgi:predicted ester cyclase
MAISQEPERLAVSRIERIRRVIEERKEDLELFSPDLVSRTQADLAVQRHANDPRAGLRLASIFSELRVNVIEAIEQGDKVVVRWRLRGSWTGALPFAPKLKPSGKAVDFTGMNIYRFVGDRVVEKTGELDSATFARQAIGGLTAESCQEALAAVSRPPDEKIGNFGFGPLV